MLTSRYLVPNQTTVIANEAGLITEYKSVYQRNLIVYKGIDNVLEFRLKNGDQKPISVAGKTPKFVAFDENRKLVIEHSGVLNVGDDSSATRGLFNVTVTENDLLNIKQQYLSYSIYLVDDVTGVKSITYNDEAFGASGTIFVSATAFPGPANSFAITTFVTQDPYWNSATIAAEPAINDNVALHTAAVYTDSYIGSVVVQGTLENQVDGSTNWATIATLTFTGDETDPVPVNFNGVFSHLRFQATADPADKITKILVRN